MTASTTTLDTGNHVHAAAAVFHRGGKRPIMTPATRRDLHRGGSAIAHNTGLTLASAPTSMVESFGRSKDSARRRTTESPANRTQR